MRSTESDPEQLPFAPGSSPFRIKGTGYRGHMAYVAAHVPGGVQAMLAEMHDARLREFFQQPFLASSWYDILPLLPAGRICASLLQTPYDEYLQARTRTQARNDLGGIYSVLLKVVSTESVALRLPRAVSQYFDFGRIETAPEEKGVVACVSAGIPRILFHWYQTVVTTYVGVALEIANVGGVKIEETEPVPDGAVRGAATLRFRWKIRWAAGG